MAEINLTAQNFDQEVLHTDKTVLVDFWATWCGPCRMLAPTLVEIAAERPDVTVGKLNVDDERALAMRYGIQSIPTVMVFKGGKRTAELIGLRPKEDYLAKL